MTFKLFITGKTSRSENAIVSLKRICKAIGTDASLELVDVLEEPETAENEKILATPTLLFSGSGMERRIIGDLSNADALLSSLDLHKYKKALQEE